MWAIVIICGLLTVSHCQSSGRMDMLADSLLQEFISRIDANQNNADINGYESQDSRPIRVAKGYSDYDPHPSKFQIRDDILLPHEPSPRKEYLEHSSLWGHQYMQGGAGEGTQRLKPDGSIKNVQVIKTDAVLPAYCNPPNPCPLGYTAEDGCLEEFENSAAFSREYQASQECMCDTEHMFDCPGTTEENELETLARSIQNEGLVDSTIDKLVRNIEEDSEDHKVVAKKFFAKKSHNPYLTGDKLPVVAKKSPHTAKGV